MIYTKCDDGGSNRRSSVKESCHLVQGSTQRFVKITPERTAERHLPSRTVRRPSR